MTGPYPCGDPDYVLDDDICSHGVGFDEDCEACKEEPVCYEVKVIFTDGSSFVTYAKAETESSLRDYLRGRYPGMVRFEAEEDGV